MFTSVDDFQTKWDRSASDAIDVKLELCTIIVKVDQEFLLEIVIRSKATRTVTFLIAQQLENILSNKVKITSGECCIHI